MANSMHERSLVKALLSQVEGLQRQECADCVVGITVSVGDFSGVELDLFQSAFDDLVDSTSARGSRLHVERVPLEAECDNCGLVFAVERFRFQCPGCDCHQVTVVRGEGLVLESVVMGR
jgi:hydrogenase nickel incorporation protein HypA/HybF